MATKILTLILFSLLLLPGLWAQDNLPTLSAIQYQIQTDSVSRTSSPQDITVTVSAGSVNDLSDLILGIDEVSAFWTVVSANLNDQTLWLINSPAPSEKQNVLAWRFDQEENSLYLYPRDDQLSSDLTLIVRLNLLRPNRIASQSSTTINMLADVGNVRYQCVTTGSGNTISFR